MTDPHAWLEEVLEEKCLSWVEGQNKEAISCIGDPTKTTVYDRILAIYNSKDKIPSLQCIGNEGQFYNFWRDEVHVQGIWRRTTLESYEAKETVWETVIDVDALPGITQLHVCYCFA